MSVGIPRVAIMGALRCGTNYLKYLLEVNYIVYADANAFAWKHGAVPILSPETMSASVNLPICYIVKNPLDFVISLYRYHLRGVELGETTSLRAGNTWDEFIMNPIVIFDSQLSGSPQLRFANPIQYWNYLYWNLETLDRSKYCVWGISYECLVSDIQCLRQVEERMPLVRRHQHIIRPAKKLKRLSRASPEISADDYETNEDFDYLLYSKPERYAVFETSHLDFIASHADPWLLSRYGYRIIA